MARWPTSRIDHMTHLVTLFEKWIIRRRLGEFASFPAFVQTLPTSSDGCTFLQDKYTKFGGKSFLRQHLCLNYRDSRSKRPRIFQWNCCRNPMRTTMAVPGFQPLILLPCNSMSNRYILTVLCRKAFYCVSRDSTTTSCHKNHTSWNAAKRCH